MQSEDKNLSIAASKRSNLTHLRMVLVCLLLIMMVVISSCAPTRYWIPPSSGGSANPGQATVETSNDVEANEPSEQSSGVTGSLSEPEISNPENPLSDPVLAAPPEANPPVSPGDAGWLITQDNILYYTQAADTLPAVAVRFGVQPGSITSTESIPDTSFLRPGQLLIIPRQGSSVDLENMTAPDLLLPDSEVVYSPSAADFDIAAFVNAAGGKLSTYSEWHQSTGYASGAQVIQRVALENSVNPRLLLSLLEYQSGWVYGQSSHDQGDDYPLGYIDPRKKGLFRQLVEAVNQLSTGYYAWREGRLDTLTFPDGTSLRMAPPLNAGTAALQYYFAQRKQGQEWLNALSTEIGLPAVHMAMFGDYWARARIVEPLYPPDIHQPPLTLPFQRNWVWAFTGGPHGAWERDGAFAALDFAPGSTEPGCVRSMAWVVAVTDGLVTRSGNGVVVLDLDGDGYEQTGWVIVYLHVSTEDRIPVGSWVSTGDQLGHPSCEGGISTGTHVHIARKYNGEWIPAAGPLPFNLGGWIAQPSNEAYKGTLVRDEITVTAATSASQKTFITRGPDDP
jgi:LasA protease